MDAPLHPDLRALLRRVGSESARLQRPAFLVGGAVRDLLLGREVQDLDFAVEGDPYRLAQAVAGGSSEVIEHRRFLTATLQTASGKIEFAATRSERYPTPAALPVVRPDSLDQDLLRRDFTVNSMARAVRPRSLGALIDPSGGLADLDRGCLRIHHRRSFVDDPTRAFRAARFEARFGWRLARDSAASLKQAVAGGLIARLSAERRRAEVELLFAESGWGEIGSRLARLGLDRTLDPGLGLSRVVQPRLERLERLLSRCSSVPELRGAPRWALALALASHAWTFSRRRRLAGGLRPDRLSSRLIVDVAGRVADVRRRLEGTPRLDAVTVDRRVGDEHPATVLLAAATSSDRRLDRAALRHLIEWRRVELAIDGHDLVAAGLEPGPRVARALRAARRARLAGRAVSAEAQLRAALRERGPA